MGSWLCGLRDLVACGGETRKRLWLGLREGRFRALTTGSSQSSTTLPAARRLSAAVCPRAPAEFHHKARASSKQQSVTFAAPDGSRKAGCVADEAWHSTAQGLKLPLPCLGLVCPARTGHTAPSARQEAVKPSLSHGHPQPGDLRRCTKQASSSRMMTAARCRSSTCRRKSADSRLIISSCEGSRKYSLASRDYGCLARYKKQTSHAGQAHDQQALPMR